MMIIHPSLKTISRYLDQQLSSAGEVRIQNHLKKCNKCRKKVQLLQVCGSFIKVPGNMETIKPNLVINTLSANIPDTQKEIIGRD